MSYKTNAIFCKKYNLNLQIKMSTKFVIHHKLVIKISANMIFITVYFMEKLIDTLFKKEIEFRTK